MSWRKREKGNPQAVIDASAFWKDSILGEDREQKATPEMISTHEAQCDTAQQAVEHYARARTDDRVLDIEVEGHATSDGVGELTIRIRESKKVELEQSPTYSGKAD